ncbi:MAG: hypothetical protein IV104_06245 [Acidovorax sp.]|nr:hypothetical protein [Acidovorax sp.]
MGKLTEFSTSCFGVFAQRVGLAVPAPEDEITPRVVVHLERCGDTLVPAFAEGLGVEVTAA